jgi:hypothetical protein
MPTHNIAEFELWQPGYAGATVTVYIAGTTTHASLFTDEALSVAAANPQTLASLTDGDGRTYGKFTAPLYTSSPYYLNINVGEQTGVQRPPLSTLAGENASAAVVTPTGASVASTLAVIASRVVYAADYGALGSTASTNTTTIAAAIGAAAARNGGEVILPNGTFPITTLTLSAGVVLRGQGRAGTILQSSTGAEVVTVSGDRAGLRDLTLDGVSKVASSVGLFGKNRAEIVLERVEIKRFATGIHFKGLTRCEWSDLYVSDCDTGVKAHGDLNTGGGSDGGDYRHNAWIGGRIQQCSVTGIEFSYEDRICIANRMEDVGFTDNTGTAIIVNGARFTMFTGCWWSGNTGSLLVRDDTDTTDTARLSNTVIGLVIDGGQMTGGTAIFRDTAQDVLLQQLDIRDVDFTLQTPIVNRIAFYDCTEDSLVTVAGEGIKLVRWNRINTGASSGVTTDNTATKAWAMQLAPGQIVCLWVSAIGRRTNAAQFFTQQAVIQAQRPGASLAYDTQTANFTAGRTITGATSGAKAVIQADSDSGATGTLTLVDIVGTFLDNEIITDGLTGSATVNGPITLNAVAAPTLTNVATLDASSFGGLTAAANGPELEIRVTGLASSTIEWSINCEITSN